MKIHKTHFGGVRRTWKSRKPSNYVWVEVSTGRYKLVRREQ